MKNKYSTSSLAKCVALSLGLFITAFSPLAQAATGTWLNTGSDWNTNANWSASPYPGSAGGDNATLAAVATAVNPNLDVNIQIATLNIDNSQADYNITTATSSVFTIDTSIITTGGGTTNIAPRIVFSSSSARTINNGTTVLNLNGGISLNATGPLLTLTNSTPVVVSSVNTTNGTGATTDVLSIQGTGSMTVTGSIASGSGFAVVKLESSTTPYTGTLRLEGSNAFSATTVWRGGTLEIANNGALGGQNITLGSSAVSTQASLFTTGAFSTPANIAFNAGANSSYTVGGSQTTGTSIYSGTVNLANIGAANNGLNLTSASGGTVSFTNVISSSAGNTNQFIKKVGNGVVKLSGVNTYSGGTFINAGTLEANTAVSGTNSATGTGSITVGATLGGTGQIRPTVLGSTQQFVSVSSGGHLAPGVVAGTPGAGIGTLTLDSGGSTAANILSMASGSDFLFALGAAGTFLIPGASDLLVISNSAVDDVAFNGNAINFLGTGAAGVYRLFDGLATSTEAADTWQGLVLGGASGREITSGLTVTNLGAGLTGTLFVGDGVSFGAQAGDIYVAVVPEPSTVIMGIFCSGIAASFYFRRKKA
ncbi:MAG: autotransporter-associated beta strand repeat-containing protein [Chthoniobacterales bacterium]